LYCDYELYRVRGISSKYFERLLSVFYATSQVIPGIGVNIQYNYKLGLVWGFIMQLKANSL
jgi:hypothetical protein